MMRSLKDMTFCAFCMGFALFLPKGAEAADGHWHPETYESFVPVTQYASLAQAVRNATHLYFPPGKYVVETPIVVDRRRPLYLHGSDRMETIIEAADPAQPMFVVRSGSKINITGIRLTKRGGTEARNFLFQNTAPVAFEMQDCFVQETVLDIKGPGEFRVQATVFQGKDCKSPIRIDHPEADFLMVGGNISNYSKSPGFAEEELFHAWLKRGRFRIYGTGTQCARGKADFRIESPAPRGEPHVIANVRSEGTTGYRKGELASSLLYVPPSEHEVDVLLMSNSGAWTSPPEMAYLVDYNAAGTLWLLNNCSEFNTTRLVIGNAPESTVVALGNRIYDRTDLLPVKATRKIYAGNIYSYHQVSGNEKAKKWEEPTYRFVNPKVKLSDYAEIPPIPKVPLPLPLGRPRLTAPLPGMANVKEPPYNAAGDGKTDDTEALQAALAAEKLVYIPAGRYRTTKPLGCVHSVYGGRARPHQGIWIAGAGPEQTVLVRDVADKGAVFLTEGMTCSAIQGITFETARFDKNNPMDVPAVGLENKNGFGGATQEIVFYDCAFIGGKFGVGIGIRTATMCSENLFVNCTFQDAQFGMGVGSYNALANIVYNGTFRDNQITITHAGRMGGGTWSLLHADIKGTELWDYEYKNSASCSWYFHGVKSDSNYYFCRRGPTGAVTPLLFDQCLLTPRQPKGNAVRFDTTCGAITFLHSVLDPVKHLRITGWIASNCGFNLHSRIPEWENTTVNGRSRIYALP